MNDYEARQERRKERLENAADRARTEADRRFNAARAEVAGIPFGQPILVGHHSEKRHRRTLERSDNHMRAAVEASKRAQELAYKAAGVGTGGISSDDPEAVTKLRVELASLKAKQAEEKAVNALYRKRDEAGLLKISPTFTLEKLDGMMAKLPSYEKALFPSYHLSNRSANMRRIEKRIEDLMHVHVQRQAVRQALEAETIAADAAAEHNAQPDGPVVIAETPASPALLAVVQGITLDGTVDGIPGEVTVRLDVDDNRVWITYPKNWITLRAAIKARGWKWSPDRGAWVRMATPGVERLAEHIVRDTLARSATV